MALYYSFEHFLKVSSCYHFYLGIRHCKYRVKPHPWRKNMLTSQSRTPLIKNTGFLMPPTQLTRVFLWFWTLPEGFRVLRGLFRKIGHCQYCVKPHQWRKIALSSKSWTPLMKNTGFLMPLTQLTRVFLGFLTLPESFRLLWRLFRKIQHCQYRVKLHRWRKIVLTEHFSCLLSVRFAALLEIIKIMVKTAFFVEKH